MKVIHIVENLDDSYGGPSRSIPALSSALTRAGCSNEICTLSWDNSDNCSASTALGVKVLTFGCWFKRTLNLSFGLALYLFHNRGQGNIYHVHNLWNAVPLITYILGRFTKTSFVVSPRGSLYKWSLSQGKFRKKIAWHIFQKRMLNSACFVHVTAESEKQALLDLGIISPIYVIPNVLSFTGVQDISIKSNDTINVLFASRLHPKKGIEILLDAWAHFSVINPSATLTICGGGDKSYTDSLKQKVIDTNIKNSVSFIGHVADQDELNRYYKCADLFVLPSYSENFGMCILEAMANGCAILTTTNTPWGSILDENFGWWVELNELNLRTALIDFSQLDLNQRHQLKENALNESLKYSPETVGCDLHSIYSRIHIV